MWGRDDLPFCECLSLLLYLSCVLRRAIGIMEGRTTGRRLFIVLPTSNVVSGRTSGRHITWRLPMLLGSLPHTATPSRSLLGRCGAGHVALPSSGPPHTHPRGPRKVRTVHDRIRIFPHFRRYSTGNIPWNKDCCALAHF